MRKIKVLIASSPELKKEVKELEKMVNHLNGILSGHDLQIILLSWDNVTGSKGLNHQNNSENVFQEYEICLVVYGRYLGSFSEKELSQVYERACQKGINPLKLYVYFKTQEDLAEDLRLLRDSFPEQYGHFTGKFYDSNVLKNDFLLQFQLFQNQYLGNSFPIVLKGSKVTLFGIDLLIDFSSLPFVSNMQQLNDIKSNLANIDILLSHLPTDNPLYAIKSEEKIKELEKKEKLEKILWETALKVTEFKEHRISGRLKRAIELFEVGKLERVLEILDSDEIKIEAEENLKTLHEGRLQKQEGLDMMTNGQKKIDEGEEGLKKTINKL